MRSGRARGIAAAAGVVLIAVARPTAAPAAVPSASPSRPTVISIQADLLTVDAAGRVATASGRVRISDGTTTATAGRAVVYHREGRGVMSQDARVVSPQGSLEGQELIVSFTARTITRVVARGSASLDAEDVLVSAQTIIIDPPSSTLVAERDVSLFTKPDVLGTGQRLVYQAARGILVLEGRARVQNADGFIEADHIEGFRREQRVVATGDVRATFRGIDVSSREAEIFMAEKKARFAGEVILTQPGRRLTTDKVTVWYADRRVVAEGQTRIRLEPEP